MAEPLWLADSHGDSACPRSCSWARNCPSGQHRPTPFDEGYVNRRWTLPLIKDNLPSLYLFITLLLHLRMIPLLVGPRTKATTTASIINYVQMTSPSASTHPGTSRKTPSGAVGHHSPLSRRSSRIISTNTNSTTNGGCSGFGSIRPKESISQAAGSAKRILSLPLGKARGEVSDLVDLQPREGSIAHAAINKDSNIGCPPKYPWDASSEVLEDTIQSPMRTRLTTNGSTHTEQDPVPIGQRTPTVTEILEPKKGE